LFSFASQVNRVKAGNEILKFASQMAGRFRLGGFKKGIERMGTREWYDRGAGAWFLQTKHM
jgi:hypothetical protein